MSSGEETQRATAPLGVSVAPASSLSVAESSLHGLAHDGAEYGGWRPARHVARAPPDPHHEHPPEIVYALPFHAAGVPVAVGLSHPSCGVLLGPISSAATAPLLDQILTPDCGRILGPRKGPVHGAVSRERPHD